MLPWAPPILDSFDDATDGPFAQNSTVVTSPDVLIQCDVDPTVVTLLNTLKELSNKETQKTMTGKKSLEASMYALQKFQYN